MHEFFNLNPTKLSIVLLWYGFCIGGGLLFVVMAIRLQSQGQAAIRAQAQPTKRRKSQQVKRMSVVEPAPDPLRHAPYRGRLALALYLTTYLLLISFGLGLAAPTVRIACHRATDVSMKLAPLVDKLTFGRLGRALASRRPAPLDLLKQALKQKTLPPTAMVCSLCPNWRAWHHLKYKLHKVYRLNPKALHEELTVTQLVDLCLAAQPLLDAPPTTAVAANPVVAQQVADHA